MKIFTIATDDYLPGVQALRNSLRQFFEPDLTLLTLGQCDLSKIEKIDRIPLEAFGVFECPTDNEWMLRAFQKLLLFNLPFHEKILYLDADQICMKDPTPLFKYPALSMPEMVGVERQYYKGQIMADTGLMVLEPDDDLFVELHHYFYMYTGDLHSADMNIINAFFYDRHPFEFCLLPYHFSMTKRVLTHFPELWNPGKAMFLHFLGPKPWTEEGRNEKEYHEVVKIWEQFR